MLALREPSHKRRYGRYCFAARAVVRSFRSVQIIAHRRLDWPWRNKMPKKAQEAGLRSVSPCPLASERLLSRKLTAVQALRNTSQQTERADARLLVCLFHANKPPGPIPVIRLQDTELCSECSQSNHHPHPKTRAVMSLNRLFPVKAKLRYEGIYRANFPRIANSQFGQ